MKSVYRLLVWLNTAVSIIVIIAGVSVTYHAGGVNNLIGGGVVRQLSASNCVYLKELQHYNNNLTVKLYSHRFAEIDSIHKIVVLGNSITRARMRKDIGWISDYGMAASSIDNDFCHVVKRALAENNPEIEIIPYNISPWEQNFSIDKDSLFGNVFDNTDVVIVRLGENVPADSIGHFDVGLRSLLDYIALKTSAQVIMTGCFWTNWQKDTNIRKVAAERDFPFISLAYLDIDANKALGGGEATDTLGNVYHFNGEFVGSHPNDQGMKAIADALLPLFTN